MVIVPPTAFADTASNSDFNPFPQMEQDVNNTGEDDGAIMPQQQNEDWPPPPAGEAGANNDAAANSEGGHD